MRRMIVAALTVALASCAMAGDRAQAPSHHAALGAWGVELSGMDTSVKPGDDFFRYVNGRWYDAATIPPDRPVVARSAISTSFRKRARLPSCTISKRGPARSHPRSRKSATFSTLMSTPRTSKNSASRRPRTILRRWAACAHEDVARAMGSVPMGTQSLFNVYLAADDKHPNQYAVNVVQSGLGLPDREYYLRDEAGTKAVREAYHKYIADMLTLGGVADAQAKADAIFALETAIAKLHWAAADRRDAEKTYNPMTMSELARMAPDFAMEAKYSQNRRCSRLPSAERSVIVAEKSAFAPLAKLFRATPVSTWRDYLIFHYLSDHAAFPPHGSTKANFAFFGKGPPARHAATKLTRRQRNAPSSTS